MALLDLPSDHILDQAAGNGDYIIAEAPAGAKIFVETDGTAGAATFTLGRRGLVNSFVAYTDENGDDITLGASDLEGVVVGKMGAVVLRMASVDGSTSVRVEWGMILANGLY